MIALQGALPSISVLRLQFFSSSFPSTVRAPLSMAFPRFAGSHGRKRQSAPPLEWMTPTACAAGARPWPDRARRPSDSKAWMSERSRRLMMIFASCFYASHRICRKCSPHLELFPRRGIAWPQENRVGPGSLGTLTGRSRLLRPLIRESPKSPHSPGEPLRSTKVGPFWCFSVLWPTL